MVTTSPTLTHRAFACVFRLVLRITFAAMSLLHRLAFKLDHILYPELRHVAVNKPLFIVGVPRSGTTYLHRAISACGDNFTVMPLWEVALAPALCEKKLFRAVRRLDRSIGGPAEGIVRFFWQRIDSLDVVHATTLWSPEEDYMTLLAFGGCFLDVLRRPSDPAVWDLAIAPETFRRERLPRLLTIYDGMLRRHLLFRGTQRHIVSKNPSLTRWVPSLAELFPDSRFIGLRRDAAISLASQLSSIRTGLQCLGWDATDPDLVDRFSRLYREYWSALDAYAQSLPRQRFRLLDFPEVKSLDAESCDVLLQSIGYQATSQDHQRLVQYFSHGQNYRSRHHYGLAEFGLDADQVRRFVTGDAGLQESEQLVSLEANRRQAGSLQSDASEMA